LFGRPHRATVTQRYTGWAKTKTKKGASAFLADVEATNRGRHVDPHAGRQPFGP
jgi:hypothetical protein